MPRLNLLVPPLLALLAACSTTSGGAAESASASASTAGATRDAASPASAPPTPAAPADTGDRARIARLEREARALATVTGCTGVAACRTAPLGVRPCGGPRDFVVYCAATTDTAALLAKLRELERVEAAWNQRSGMMSTCEMRMAPRTALVGGRCTAQPATGPGLDRVP